jgi:hypothetical protein
VHLQGVSKDIAREVIPEPIGAEFAAGACRNIALLLTAGLRVIMADDDTLACTWSRRRIHGEIAFHGRDDYTETTFHPSRADALSRVEFGGDLVREHGALLGASLRSLAMHAVAHYDGATSHQLMAADGVIDGTVQVTMSSLLGDGTSRVGFDAFLGSGLTRAALYESPEMYGVALRSREVIRSVRRPTVVAGVPLMTYCVGIDNRTCTPPFPLGIRGEDAVFSAVMTAVSDSAYTAHIPVGIVHASQRLRCYGVARRLRLPPVRDSDALAGAALAWWQSGVCDDDRSLPALGDFMIGLGLAPSRDVVRFVRQIAVTQKKLLIRLLDDSARSDNAIEMPWTKDLINIRASLAAQLEHEGGLDRSPTTRESAFATHAQDRLRQYGRLLSVWPQVRSAVRFGALSSLA